MLVTNIKQVDPEYDTGETVQVEISIRNDGVAGDAEVRIFDAASDRQISGWRTFLQAGEIKRRGIFIGSMPSGDWTIRVTVEP